MDLPVIDLRTPEQALSYLDSLYSKMMQARFQCDVSIPDNVNMSVHDQKNAERIFLVNHGAVLGALVVLQGVRLISDSTYMEYRQKVLNALAGGVLGSV